MGKKIIIELTDQEYQDLQNSWEKLKSFAPAGCNNFDDFCKQTLMSMTKTPDFDSLKNINMDELLQNMKDLMESQGFTAPTNKPKNTEETKEEIPDDQKYKS